MTLVNKIILVSSAQFYDTFSVYYTVCPPPKVNSSFITIYLTPSTPYCIPFPLVITVLLSVSMVSCLFIFLGEIPFHRWSWARYLTSLSASSLISRWGFSSDQPCWSEWRHCHEKLAPKPLTMCIFMGYHVPGTIVSNFCPSQAGWWWNHPDESLWTVNR